MARTHYLKATRRAVCGEPVAERHDAALNDWTREPSRVDCGRCLCLLKRGVLVLDQQTGATVIVKYTPNTQS